MILDVVVKQAPQGSDFIRPDVKANNSCDLLPVPFMQAPIADGSDEG